MYQLLKIGSILRLEDGAFIPIDESSSDYLAFLAWKDAGNTPLAPEDERPPIPQEE